VLVDGELQSRSYEKDGKTVYVTEVIVNRVVLLDNKQKVNSQDTLQSSPRSVALNTKAKKTETTSERPEIIESNDLDSNDLPF
jgi:single-strand DNA-binding protein